MTRHANGLVRFNIYLQPQVVEGMKRIALARGTTYSDLVRTACREYVLREGAELVKESLALKELAK